MHDDRRVPRSSPLLCPPAAQGKLAASADMGIGDRGMAKPEPGLVTYRGTVYPADCDHMGHMNVASYVAKFDEASWCLFFELGLVPSYLRGEQFGMAGVQQNITYSQELFPGDVLEVRSRMLEVGDKRIRFEHTMYNLERGEVAAVMDLTAVHLDKIAHKACPFPAAVREKAQSLLAPRGRKAG
jgi:acyl-CoA thioester hydrolase